MRKIYNAQIPNIVWDRLLGSERKTRDEFGRIYHVSEVKGVRCEISYHDKQCGILVSAEADNVTAMSELYKRIWDLRKSGIYPMIYNYGHLYVELYVKGE